MSVGQGVGTRLEAGASGRTDDVHVVMEVAVRKRRPVDPVRTPVEELVVVHRGASVGHHRIGPVGGQVGLQGRQVVTTTVDTRQSPRGAVAVGLRAGGVGRGGPVGEPVDDATVGPVGDPVNVG